MIEYVRFSVLGQSGLLSMLKKDGQYTLMAPSNSAFNRLNPDIRRKLLSGQQCIKGNNDKNKYNNKEKSNKTEKLYTG